jgi:hypothetical protein
MSNKVIYPSSNELKDVLYDNVLHSELLGFLRSKGIFYFNTSKEDAAMLTSRLLFDGEALEKLRQYAYRTTQKSLLSGFTLVSNSFFDLNSIDESVQEKEVLTKDGYHLKSLYRIGDKKFGGSIVFNKRRPGKNTFLKYEERDISFRMEELTRKKWQVEIDGENSTDGKVIQSMFSVAVKGKEITMEEIMFDGLSDEAKIIFFDRLAKEGLSSEWSIEDVLRLTLKKPKSQTPESEDEENLEENKNGEPEDVKEATQEQLSGIAQAILEGKNLRENKFVHLAEEGGYVFSSMTYLFERSNDNCHLKIRAEFKGNPKIFEVSLEGFPKTATGAEGYVVMDLTEEQNYDHRSTFWNAAKKIYNELKN